MLEKEIHEIIVEFAKERLAYVRKKFPEMSFTLEKITDELIDYFLNPRNSMDYLFRVAVEKIRELRKK